MAYNSERRAVHFLVYGVHPPSDPNVLWMDTSTVNAPVLKIFLSGAWISVHTLDEQEFNKELQKKLDITTFNTTVRDLENAIDAASTKADEVEERVKSDIEEAKNDLEDSIEGLQGDVGENSTSIYNLNQKVENLRVIRQEIVDSLDNVTDPNISTIYLVLDEQSNTYDAYIYIEDTESFSLLSSNDVPTIYINSLDTDLNTYTTPGLYNVVYSNGNNKIPYSLYVSFESYTVPPRGTRYRIYQCLFGVRASDLLVEIGHKRSRYVYANSSGEAVGEWSEWSNDFFASETAVNNEVSNRNAAITAAKNEVKENIKQELLPLIYAAL